MKPLARRGGEGRGEARADELTVARVVLDQPGAVAITVAPVVGLEEQAAEAAGAVLPEPAGLELAVLARGRGHRVGGALAAVTGVRANDPAIPALKRGQAPALELAKAERCHVSRARRNTSTVDEIGTIPADAA